jgi:hypothetical protein
MKLKLLLAFDILGFVLLASTAHADLVWQTPYGQIGLPLTAIEALSGYDAVLKQGIFGTSLPVYIDPKKLFALQVGAIAPVKTNGPTVEPYVAGGLDILREIPGLAQYQSAHLNVFGRYSSNQGKAGVGISFSYSFVTSPTPATSNP